MAKTRKRNAKGHFVKGGGGGSRRRATSAAKATRKHRRGGGGLVPSGGALGTVKGLMAPVGVGLLGFAAARVGPGMVLPAHARGNVGIGLSAATTLLGVLLLRKRPKLAFAFGIGGGIATALRAVAVHAPAQASRVGILPETAPAAALPSSSGVAGIVPLPGVQGIVNYR